MGSWWKSDSSKAKFIFCKENISFYIPVFFSSKYLLKNYLNNTLVFIVFSSFNFAFVKKIIVINKHVLYFLFNFHLFFYPTILYDSSIFIKKESQSHILYTNKKKLQRHMPIIPYLLLRLKCILIIYLIIKNYCGTFNSQIWINVVLMKQCHFFILKYFYWSKT